MNSKERLLRAVNHQQTDRVPFDMFGTNPVMRNRIMNYLKANSYEEMYDILGIDFWNLKMLPFTGEKRFYRGKEADFWGISEEAYKSGDSSNECPLKDISCIDEVENYQWPTADDFNNSEIEKEINEHGNFVINGHVWAPIFHNLTWLCGFETTLANLHLQQEVSEAIIRHITDFWVDYTRKVLDAGKGKIDIVSNCNDFGAQNSMIMSPDTFRRFFKPALKRLYDVIKEYDTKVFQHSCGAIAPIIPDLIEIGVDIINPVQISAAGMSPEILKASYGSQITFHGAIDTQYILPNGNEEDVRREVNRIVHIMGQGGGYVLSGSQGFEDDIPVKNIIAMYDEGKKEVTGNVYYNE